MNRYWLFTNDTYYSAGGMLDFLSSHNTVGTAIKTYDRSGHDWCHVFDSKTHKVVFEAGIVNTDLNNHKVVIEGFNK